MRRLFLLIPAAILAFAVLWWSQRQTGPYVVSGYIEADEIRLGSRVGGRVREVSTLEGAEVRRGDVLVTLEPFNLQERLAEAQATLAAQRAKLKELKDGFRPEEIAQARARRDRLQTTVQKLEAGLRPLEIKIREEQLREAQAEAAWAQADYQRVSKLRENNQAAQEEMDQAVRRLETARARNAAAEDELSLAREGPRAEEIAEARASLAEAEAQLKLQENGYRAEDVAAAEAQVQAAEAGAAAIARQIDELSIQAPVDGFVEAIDLQPGDLVAANAPVLTLLDKKTLWVRTYIPENRLGLEINDRVALRVDAYPGERFAGRVAFISRQAEFYPANVQTPDKRVKQMFRIKVRIEEGLDRLHAGMSVDVFLEPEK